MEHVQIFITIIDVGTGLERKQEVKATVKGHLAVHANNQNDTLWAVTHLGTGRAITSEAGSGSKIKSEEHANSLRDELLASGIKWYLTDPRKEISKELRAQVKELCAAYSEGNHISFASIKKKYEQAKCIVRAMTFGDIGFGQMGSLQVSRASTREQIE